MVVSKPIRYIITTLAMLMIAEAIQQTPLIGDAHTNSRTNIPSIDVMPSIDAVFNIIIK